MGRRARSKRRRNEKAINVSCSPVLISLCQWLSSLGWISTQPLSPALFPTTGRGLQAKASISAGSVLISLPRAALITASTVRQSPLGKLIESLCGRIPTNITAQELLALWLVSERYKGASSSYFPYLQSLPSQYTVPYFCSPAEISSLPHYLRSLVEKQIETVKNGLNKVIKFKNDVETLSELDLDKFAWAWFTVNTRAVFYDEKSNVKNSSGSSEENLALAPYLDLFNHDPQVSVRAGVGLDIRVGDGGDYQIVTNNAISKHNQVFINYGPHSNTKLLLEYGFFLPNNPHESFPVSKDHFRSYCDQRKSVPQNFEEKMNLLSQQKLCCNVNISSDGLSWNGKACLQVLLMSRLELKNWFTVYDTAESESVAKEAGLFVSFIYKELKQTEIQSVEVTSSFQLMKQLVHSHQNLLQCLC